jgi:5'-nucleotidase
VNGAVFLESHLVSVLILLTNDDGVYAPGLAAMGQALQRLGEVYVVAPATEQSGVGHAITYLTPLIVKQLCDHDARPGTVGRRWAVQGSPADCVKIGITRFCPRQPDLVVSGINAGLNAGINVLYSGTVAAAIEGAFFGVTSMAVSLERAAAAVNELDQFAKAADLAASIIEQILNKKGPEAQLYNLNIPTAALGGPAAVCAVPMNVIRYGDSFEKRTDPWGRDYYWFSGGPPESAPGHETDLSALAKGRITLTPLDYDLTRRAALAAMEQWRFNL